MGGRSRGVQAGRPERGEVSTFCRACGSRLAANRSTRRYCSGACKQAAWRAGRKHLLAPVAHQRRIRDVEAAREPRPRMESLAGAKVEQFTYAEAKAIVVRYEWLRSMPTGTRACYELRTASGELAGAVVFAAGPCPRAATYAAGTSRPRDLPCARRLRPLGPSARGFVLDLEGLQAGEQGLRLGRVLRLCGSFGRRGWDRLPSGELALSRRRGRARSVPILTLAVLQQARGALVLAARPQGQRAPSGRT
jgi:hypothetical protein